VNSIFQSQIVKVLQGWIEKDLFDESAGVHIRGLTFILSTDAISLASSLILIHFFQNTLADSVELNHHLPHRLPAPPVCHHHRCPNLHLLRRQHPLLFPRLVLAPIWLPIRADRPTLVRRCCSSPSLPCRRQRLSPSHRLLPMEGMERSTHHPQGLPDIHSRRHRLR
jgi:hypothetical protein